MIKVQVKFSVRDSKMVGTKILDLEVDESTYKASLSSGSISGLSGWAEQFFPSAKEVKVISMRKI